MTNIAILGFGVVGSGVAEVFTNGAQQITQRAGQEISVKSILDIRDFPDCPYHDRFVKDFALIEQDSDIAVVAEVIGGTGAAYDFTRRALEAGKHVVTSNKELVAAHGAELLALAQRKGLQYLFEASVGGGIPIIRPLARCLAANRITRVTGILNGTCNYILTRMVEQGISFADALQEAQQNGYAEANPAADIEGVDTCRKICILASLSFGTHIYPDSVRCQGISHVTMDMMNQARAAGYAIKLVGQAVRRESGDLEIITAPHLVPHTHPFFSVSDVFNAILVDGDATGDVMFYGKGAGKLPTASAVAADIIDCVTGAPGAGIKPWHKGTPGLSPGQPEAECYTFANGDSMRILR